MSGTVKELEFREDLEYTVPLYNGESRGILTLGEFRTIEFDNGKKLELLPYILNQHCRRGTSKDDPRIRRNNRMAIPLLAEPYARHYNEAGLDEHWSNEDVINMLNWHLKQNLGHFFLVKWARDVQTGEEFPIGFITAYLKPYQSGAMLWDGEIFVLPEFQKYGVGSELFQGLLTLAKKQNVELFEALTYRDENGFPCKLWEKYGAQTSDLVHIHGEVDEMLSKVKYRAKSGKKD